ncbi:MAG: MBL fold metallo-hydrolase [Clostridia bacterium]|nr:MBL fold metallo-hydrolase [Clostridia bacterium]
MIGVSLPYEWLASGQGLLGNVDSVLTALKRRGVESVELRTVFLRHDPAEVLRVAEMLWDRGFQISVHVKAHSEQEAVREVFEPLSRVLSHLRQERLVVVLHPVRGDNVAMLHALADHRDAHGYPVTIALENNRLMPDKTEGDCAALVFDAVHTANRENVGICFDMGHYCYYRKQNVPQKPFRLPAKEFWQRVVHTHIHALDGMKTHFPLGAYELPLEEIFSSLSRDYFGVYNIELDFPRFKELSTDLPGALYASVDFLSGALPMYPTLYDRIRREFDSAMERTLAMMEHTEGTQFSLLGSSSYFFQTTGYRWIVDPSFRHAYHLCKTPHRLAELLKDTDLILITHGHEDHFEEKTVRQLATTRARWILPAFLEEQALAWGIEASRMTLVHEGDVVQAGPLTVRVFPGRHFRPGTSKGVPTYGYYITAEGEPSLVFPSDVRDYSLEGLPALPPADYCFAHVWLGDKNACAADYGTLPREFADFMLAFSRKHLLFGHLYESARRDTEMWKEEHARRLAEAVRERSPSTVTYIPTWGEVLDLTCEGSFPPEFR